MDASDPVPFVQELPNAKAVRRFWTAWLIVLLVMLAVVILVVLIAAVEADPPLISPAG